MSDAETVDLRPLVEHIGRVIKEIRDADIQSEQEVDRTRAVRILEATKETVRALCYNGDPDLEFPVFAMPGS